jgi:hypothetical protein
VIAEGDDDALEPTAVRGGVNPTDPAFSTGSVGMSRFTEHAIDVTQHDLIPEKCASPKGRGVMNK